jgi:hypothetical protein
VERIALARDDEDVAADAVRVDNRWPLPHPVGSDLAAGQIRFVAVKDLGEAMIGVTPCIRTPR